MNKMRVSITQRGNELVGTVQSEGDALFVLECLAEIVQQISKKSGVAAGEVVQDLYALVMGRVK